MKSAIRTANDWMIAFLVLIGIGVADYFITGGGTSLHNLFTYLNPMPSSTLSGFDTLASFYLYRGEVAPDMRFSYKAIAVLVSVVLLLIVFPWMLYRGYAEEQIREANQKPWYWYLGASFCLCTLALIPALILSQRVQMNSNAAWAAAQIEQKMQNELTDVSFEAVEYAILEDGFEDSFSVKDLGIDNLQFTYSVTQDPGDSILIITATSSDHEDIMLQSHIDPSNTDAFFKLRN